MLLTKRNATLVFLCTLASCATIPSSYFTADVRRRVESKNIPLQKIQFYVDKDLELRRELTAKDAKVNSGKVKFENGKYINIIKLKKYTKGVCTRTGERTIDVSFETGDGKSLSFTVPAQAGPQEVYTIAAEKWIRNEGKVRYDGETYFIQPGGEGARLMIQKSAVDKLEVSKRVMPGRNVEQ